MYILACLGVFFAAYLLQVTVISVFYHRGLAHSSLVLKPWLRRFVAHTGIWFTGLDPKAWVCMHRMHHEHSDRARDPHSPVHYGFFGVLLGQLRSYERTLVRLAKGDPIYTFQVTDLDFPTHWLNRHRLWFVPYLAHLLVALAIAVPTGFWGLGVGYWIGMMSHPIQGWLVNSLGHAVGGRNFDTPDNSRNNTLAAWLIFGEGFQNNHHQYPESAKFSFRPAEVDLGYGICLFLERFGLLSIEKASLLPAYASHISGKTPSGLAKDFLPMNPVLSMHNYDEVESIPTASGQVIQGKAKRAAEVKGDYLTNPQHDALVASSKIA